ncbi:hypothetical protein COD67_07645 [Bacillus cereus]|nr:hypothetical protein COI89_08710 [Bacillus cereus]PGU68130.1 hypothetical protein COD67_07645 [Bacillus cereus]
MDTMNVSTSLDITIREIHSDEEYALNFWTTKNWKNCYKWVSDRKLNPPMSLIHKYTHKLEPIDTKEFEKSLQVLDTITENTPQKNTALNFIAHQLKNDTNLHQFYKNIFKMSLSEFYLVQSKEVICPTFSRQNKTLYLPEWLVNNLPSNVFEVNALFPKKRVSSLSWLLLDSLYIKGPKDIGFYWEFVDGHY